MNWPSLIVYAVFDVIRLSIPLILAFVISSKLSMRIGSAPVLGYVIWPAIFILLLFGGGPVLSISPIGIEFTIFFATFLLSLLVFTVFFASKESQSGIHAATWLSSLLLMKYSYLRVGNLAISLPSLGASLQTSLAVNFDASGIAASVLIYVVIVMSLDRALQFLSSRAMASNERVSSDRLQEQRPRLSE